MKKLTFTAILLAILSFSLNTNMVVAQGNGSGKAIAAFHQSCNYQGAVSATEPSVVGACFVSGFITRVNIIPKINCQQIDCSLIRIGAVGYVEFGCDGDVINVVCY